MGNAEAMKNETLDPESLPTVRIWKDRDGLLWTLDHRRLAAMKVVGLSEISYRWALPEEIATEMWKKTTTNGESIRLKMEDGNSKTVYQDGQVTECADTAAYLLWAQYLGLVGESVKLGADCTRADAVTQLWKLAASPKATQTEDVFLDVPPQTPATTRSAGRRKTASPTA